MVEIWKDIPGFDGVYQASNLGRIKSTAKSYTTRYGTLAVRKERVFKMQTLDSCGYVSVQIGKTQRAHRLIALTFITNPDNKPFVNHINGIKHDNRVENLEWCTKSENAKHSFSIGLQSNTGEQHPKAKLTNELVGFIRKNFKPRLYSSRKIAAELGVSKTTVLDVINGKIWNHI